MNTRIAIILMMMAVFLGPADALAHKVNVYAWHEGGEAHAEAYFADGMKCKGCKVEVIDPASGKLLLEGKTDGEGQFTFGTTGGDAVKVVVNAGPGHRGEYVLAREDAAAPETTATEAVNGTALTVDTDAQRKIDDLTAELKRVREEASRPGLAEILGGIGWIVGILGIAAYLKSRKAS